jgi:hypothetical protein
MGPINFDRLVGPTIRPISDIPPHIPFGPPGPETDQELPLSFPSRSITSRRNRSGGPHWSPKVVSFLTVNDMRGKRRGEVNDRGVGAVREDHVGVPHVVIIASSAARRVPVAQWMPARHHSSIILFPRG